MNRQIRSVAAGFAACVLAIGIGCVPAAAADTYPTHPIRLVVTAAAGGTSDFLARWMAKGVSETVSQPIIVENKGGAGGNVGADLVAKSAPDGYTLALVASGNIVINPWMYKSLPFDPMHDLIPVFNVGNAPQFLVVPASLHVKTLKEFVALGKTKPDGLNYASAGSGSTTHLAMDHLGHLTGIKLVHVPYKGVGAAVTDLVAGRVQALSTSIPPVRAQLASGDLVALCLAAPKRLAAAPDIPTAAEAGLPGYEMTTWFGILAPKGTDPKIVDYLNVRFQKALDSQETQQRFKDLGIAPNGGTAAQFEQTIQGDYKYWGPIVKESGVTLE